MSENQVHFIGGASPSPIDRRDILMSSVLPEFKIPKKFVVENITPLRSQGDEGTCVAFACVAMKEWQEQKEKNKYTQLSPRYLYQKCKEIDNLPPVPCQEERTYLRIALDILLKQGVCEENYWPYKPCQPDIPIPNADENASNYKVIAYALLDNVEIMKRSLLYNGPFVMLTSMYENWFTQDVSLTGKIPLPGESKFKGGHAVCAVGYDDDTQYFKFKNSWYDETNNRWWGDDGYGYLPYQYIEQKQAENFFFEAYSTTDLLEDVAQKLVDIRESVLNILNIYRFL
ncbi:C1 family peptidase [Bacillus safensis]|uniref:C1 family peptidase n=1 Tax=Bacillus safensis TaxID=561879 RepID=UPI00201D3337|nr:C1 family peptidase [Bacillus safensis]UQZ91650.1 hypothetical protein EI692_01120 [Bacillus safensis]